MNRKADFLLGVAGISVLFAVWSLITYGGYIRPLFLPTPTGIWEGLVDFYRRGWLVPSILRSLWRVSQSLALVISVGVPIGVLMGTFPSIDALLRRIVNGFKSIPTTGLLGLIILWFSIEESAKIVFLFLGSIFYMIILVRNAIAGVNKEYVRLAMGFGGTSRQIICRVLFPAALPQIWDAIAVCNGIMWTYIVLAEFINSSEEQLGLGYLLYIGGRTQQSGEVFATLVVIACLSVATDTGLGVIRKRFLSW